MKLTTTESEILKHRLEVPDAIYSVFADSDLPYTEEEVTEACDTIIKGLPELPADLTECMREVLDDAVQGSTFLGAAHRQTSEQRERSIYAVGCRLAVKVGGVIGRTLIYPAG